MIWKGRIFTRRSLLKTGMGAAAALAADLPLLRSAAGILAPAYRLRIGVIGLGRRGALHLGHLAALPGVEIAALCDLDASRVSAGRERLAAWSLPPPVTASDFRALLHDRSLDAVSIAAPEPWAATMAIDACKAGKDVYVERLGATGLRRTQELAQLAERSGRIVQHGASPLASHMAEWRQILAEGTTGGLDRIRLLCLRPAAVDRSAVHGEDTREGGDGGWPSGQALDALHAARRALALPRPMRIATMAGGSHGEATRSCFDYPADGGRGRLRFDWEVVGTLQPPGTPRARDEARGEAWVAGQLELHGPGGRFLNRFLLAPHGLSQPAERVDGYGAVAEEAENFANFIACARDRRAAALRSPISEVTESCWLTHLADVSLQLRRPLHLDPATGLVLDDEQASQLLAAS